MGDDEEKLSLKRGRDEEGDLSETESETSDPPAKLLKEADDDGEPNVANDTEQEEDTSPVTSSETKENGAGNAVPPQDKTADDGVATTPEGSEEEESEAASEADSEPAPGADSEPEAPPADFSNAEDEPYEETGDVSAGAEGATTSVASTPEDAPLYDDPSLPPGVPSGLPDAPVDPTQAATISNPESIAEERAELATEFVGRVIGKGGEMIRDLQARSGCRVDVDQNVPVDSPRIITYRGTRQAIDFAKQLVATLCSQEGKRDADLPLGMAARKQLIVPSSAIGKIIGRGGEMIRDLQNRSKGKIQVDHSGAGMTDPSTRLLTITGTQEAVTKAEEMIMFLVANPQMDAAQAIDMLVDDKTRGGGTWGSGPPYPNLPNQGRGMQIGTGYGGGGYAAPYGGGGAAPYGGGAAPYGGGAAPYGGGAAPYGGGPPPYGGGPPLYGGPTPYGGAGGGYQQPPGAYGSSVATGTEVEVFYSPKMYMGRLIGSRGITINDVQKRSGCDIQINQDVPPGHDCEISIKGSRQGIEMTKGMLQDIIEMGPSHPYAGGTGGAPQQPSYGGGGGYDQRGGYSQGPPMQAYQYPQAAPQPALYGSYPYGAPTYDYQHAPVYGHQEMPPYQAAPPQQYGMPPQPNYGGYSQPPPMHTPVPATWRSATTADGQTYYYNEKTGETQWEKPMGM